jgi:hypothetical protein
MSGGRDVTNGINGQGSEWCRGGSRMQQDDEGSSEMDGGEVKSTESIKLDVFIMGEMSNKQLKNQVTYDYMTPTPRISKGE